MLDGNPIHFQLIEQICGRHVTARSDKYLLAFVLLHPASVSSAFEDIRHRVTEWLPLRQEVY